MSDERQITPLPVTAQSVRVNSSLVSESCSYVVIQ